MLTGLYLLHPAMVRYNAVSNAQHAVVDAKQGGSFAHNVWGPSSIFFINNNATNMSGWRNAGNVADIEANPMWADPEHGNFSIPPTSPLIAAHAGVTSALPLNR